LPISRDSRVLENEKGHRSRERDEMRREEKGREEKGREGKRREEKRREGGCGGRNFGVIGPFEDLWWEWRQGWGRMMRGEDKGWEGRGGKKGGGNESNRRIEGRKRGGRLTIGPSAKRLARPFLIISSS
jgi:hypothetical protein